MGVVQSQVNPVRAMEGRDNDNKWKHLLELFEQLEDGKYAEHLRPIAEVLDVSQEPLKTKLVDLYTNLVEQHICTVKNSFKKMISIAKWVTKYTTLVPRNSELKKLVDPTDHIISLIKANTGMVERSSSKPKKKDTRKRLRDWTPDEVFIWAKGEKHDTRTHEYVKKCATKFKDNSITGKDLTGMTVQKLRSLGVKKKHTHKIMEEINYIKQLDTRGDTFFVWRRRLQSRLLEREN